MSNITSKEMDKELVNFLCSVVGYNGKMPPDFVFVEVEELKNIILKYCDYKPTLLKNN